MTRVGERRENARFETKPDTGKERWRSSEHSPIDDETKERYAFVHRLAAVAWMDSATWRSEGLDALEGLVVHHSTPVDWLNTQDNLECHTRDVHSAHHLHGRDLPEPVLPLEGDDDRGTDPDDAEQVGLDHFARAD